MDIQTYPEWAKSIVKQVGIHGTKKLIAELEVLIKQKEDKLHENRR